MKTKLTAALTGLSLLLSLALPGAAAGVITHGTAKEWISEEQLIDQAPRDYSINSATQADAKEGKYTAFFLEDQLQTVCIEIDETNFNYLLQNAPDEPYVMTKSVTIGETTLGYCGLRTKGNYTLYHAYHDNPGSDRFSFTVNFGKFVDKLNFGEKQTFYGCEKISFNNFFFDKSMMKEFFSLKLMDEMGLPTPAYGLAKLYINGQYYGVYFMVEAMDETVLERHWKVDSDQLSSYLCKPTNTRLNYGSLAMDPGPLYQNNEEKQADVADMLPTVLEWTKKLNDLSAGRDFNGNPIDVNSQEYIDLLSQILDLEEVIKYFAVCSWLCQLDNMFTNLQNFGLYVSPQGVATLLPWDYDLAFGCYYPSTAENTANYPVDVMYQLDRNLFGKDGEFSQRTYAQFPLFYVIYQNASLMEKYHSYMAQCSQVAALGGTVEATGKSYAPGYFNSFIEAMDQELIAAASEELAGNVYYMNHISQPEGVKNALSNLAAIIAQRSVGVWAQVNGMDTWVSGAGCDLETLGNAMTGEYANAGTLTSVDPATGIFVTADYEGGRRAFAPGLTATLQPQDNQLYTQAAQQLEPGRNEALLVYTLSSNTRAASDYTVTIPMDPQFLNEEALPRFYALSGSNLTPLEMTQDGNLFTGTLKNLGTVVILTQQPRQSHSITVFAIGLMALCAAGTGAILIRRKKKTQK